MKLISFMLAAGMFLLSVPDTWAQGRGNDKKASQNEELQNKELKDKELKNKAYKNKDLKNKEPGDKAYKNKTNKAGQDRYSHREHDKYEGQRPAGKAGEVLGRVVLPARGVRGPRRLEGVPRGHYPPPGKCRVWYPNRPPGHQPPPTDCHRLAGMRLEPGAFVLHGDQAYDAGYDWREEDRRRPGTVSRDILDILFPRH